MDVPTFTNIPFDLASSSRQMPFSPINLSLTGEQFKAHLSFYEDAG